MVGREYIYFLLYSEDGEGETAWVKLRDNMMLRICCVWIAETATSDTVVRAPGGLASSLVIAWFRLSHLLYDADCFVFTAAQCVRARLISFTKFDLLSRPSGM